MKYVVGFLLIIFPFFISAGTSEEGIISQLYVNDEGRIAVKLKDGFPNASVECPGHNGWAGTNSTDPVIKSALLAAKASGSIVSLSIYGCDDGWLKVKGVYIK